MYHVNHNFFVKHLLIIQTFIDNTSNGLTNVCHWTHAINNIFNITNFQSSVFGSPVDLTSSFSFSVILEIRYEVQR